MRLGVNLSLRSDAPSEIGVRPWVSKASALICLEDGCEAVYPADGFACPACGSMHGWPLAKVTDRERPQRADEADIYMDVGCNVGMRPFARTVWRKCETWHGITDPEIGVEPHKERAS